MLISLRILIKTAKKLGITPQIIDPDNNLVEFKRGKRSVIIYRTITDLNSPVSLEISANKALTSQILKKNGLPVQFQVLCSHPSKAIAQKIGFPLVVNLMSAPKVTG